MKKHKKRALRPIESIPKKYLQRNEDSKYEKWYNSIINNCKQKTYKDDEYREVHHIVPICLGGTDDISNLVEVSAKEHIILHKLLREIYPSCPGLILALKAMTLSNSRSKRTDAIERSFSTKELARLREDSAKAQIGKEKSLETRRKLSKSLRGRKFTELWKQNLSNSAKKRVARLGNNFKGKHHSNSSIQKMLKTREDNGISYKGKNNPNSKKVIDQDGRIFNTVSDCAKYYGVSYSLISYRINKKPELGFKYYKE